ncbi:type IV pilus twitching motility protein PilT [Terrimesophilobacter mesophilus]|uniref:Type IV pilus twitching motility protein PilT n=2 Tax=Terrimesophilobacter mesophilus TaxID=433647 RepID=A0A4R8VF23_9MICO|nr:type IV pilus twitching motility protein PilT [Terrimesophilobacter mesophilus]
MAPPQVVPQSAALPVTLAPPVVPPAAPVMAQQQPPAGQAPVPVPAGQAAVPAPAAQSAPPAAPVPASVSALAPPVMDTLLEDIDPLGRVETGFSPHPGADPDLIAALQEVVRLTASDLHVTSNAPPMLRVDGSLTPVEGADVWGRERVTDALHSILTKAQRETFEQELELDFAFAVSENARFRVNFYQQRDSVGGAFRLIPTEIKPLEQLGVPDTVARFAELARGLVLVTGPTGSGKSTTLAALIDLVNRTRTDHIVTVEDPIEFMHGNKRSLINQREVGSDTHSFAQALKHVLRQDPDVILIGELRDLETISVALTAAETGHLVFATLHTQDAAQTIDRVIDVFPPHAQEQVRAQLAATLQGVVCQTLVKVASGKGRVVATEVMVITPAIANLIREGKTYQIQTALQAGRELGMFTMDQHLAELVDKGKITHAAAIEKAHDIEGLKALIHRADPGGGDIAQQMASAASNFGDGFARKAN